VSLCQKPDHEGGHRSVFEPSLMRGLLTRVMKSKAPSPLRSAGALRRSVNHQPDADREVVCSLAAEVYGKWFGNTRRVSVTQSHSAPHDILNRFGLRRRTGRSPNSNSTLHGKPEAFRTSGGIAGVLARGGVQHYLCLTTNQTRRNARSIR